MSNRYANQFIKNLENQPFLLAANFAQVGAAGVAASLVANGITYTAVRMGTAGNSITIALIAGGTAGAEVVTVSGTAISIQIESGVSTRTQVKTALDASAAAVALISTSVTSGGTAATLSAAAPLASGTDAVFTRVGRGMLMTQIAIGVYQLTLSEPYAALLSADIVLQRAAAVDLMPQIQSVDVTAAGQKIVFRMQTAATPTSLASGDVVYVSLLLRNQSR